MKLIINILNKIINVFVAILFTSSSTLASPLEVRYHQELKDKKAVGLILNKFEKQVNISYWKDMLVGKIYIDEPQSLEIQCIDFEKKLSQGDINKEDSELPNSKNISFVLLAPLQSQADTIREGVLQIVGLIEANKYKLNLGYRVDEPKIYVEIGKTSLVEKVISLQVSKKLSGDAYSNKVKDLKYNLTYSLEENIKKSFEYFTDGTTRISSRSLPILCDLKNELIKVNISFIASQNRIIPVSILKDQKESQKISNNWVKSVIKNNAQENSFAKGFLLGLEVNKIYSTNSALISNEQIEIISENLNPPEMLRSPDLAKIFMDLISFFVNSDLTHRMKFEMKNGLVF
ncbi:MAG TPA: hypothetical protein PLJ21_02360 [Pseudobdellovibrionaceae bacterium]|nr:hypothetical protein [Pseudobdellovibrionaceae bacterium]